MRNEGFYQGPDGVSTFATHGLEIDIEVGLVALTLCFAPRIGVQKQVTRDRDLVPLLVIALEALVRRGD